MVRIRSVDVMSCAKIVGVLQGAIGLLVGAFIMIAGLAGLGAAPSPAKLGMFGMLMFAALTPFLYGALGFVFGAIGALLYNWVASAIGGILLELEAVPAPYFEPQPPTPDTSV